VSGITTRLEHGRKLDLKATWGGVSTLHVGVGTQLRDGHGVRAFHTPVGPVELEVLGGDDSVVARAWGDGAQWALDRLPQLLGVDDGTEDFVTDHPLVARLQRQHAGVRHAHAGDVLGLAVQTVFGQLVTGKEAGRAWGGLARAHGARSPGPHQLLMAPPGDVIARLPRPELVRLGALGKMADTIGRLVRQRSRIDELAWSDLGALAELLSSLRGVGPWTVGMLQMRGLGDPDGVPVGDYHMPNTVAWVLERTPRSDDARMLELLAPFAPFRGRVIRLFEAAGLGAPKYGARQPIRNLDTR